MKPGFVVFALIVLALLSYALYAALVLAPTEQTMGDVQRIFYYHVPSAWTGMLLFFINFLASVQYLVRPRADKAANWIVVAVGVLTCIGAYVVRPLPQGIYPSSIATTGIAIVGVYFLIRKYFSQETTDILALTTAEVGLAFWTVVLITGPIWARPVWGIWWTWDARLTSTLVMWLIYVSYLILRRFSAGTQTPALAAALAVFGFADVPFVYFSIWYFRTQHPQPVIGGGGSLDPAMWHVVLWNWLAFTAFAALVCSVRWRLETTKRQVEALHAAATLEGGNH